MILHIENPKHSIKKNSQIKKNDLIKFVWMYGCESCTIKKAECQRIDAFELWC